VPPAVALLNYISSGIYFGGSFCQTGIFTGFSLRLFFVIEEEQRSWDRLGGGGAQRPIRCVDEPKKTGARSARARTRGQNPLEHNIHLIRKVK